MDKKEVYNEFLVPFSLPSRDLVEVNYVLEAMNSRHRHGAGPFTVRSVAALRNITGVSKILLTHSCTGALELAMLLMNIQKDDEVILPSFTFSSTANAVALQGAVPVFADIDPLTQCLDPNSVRELITPRTRAILPVHYAGVGCDMEALGDLAKQNSLAIIEDAAQAIGATRNGKALGAFGELGAFSFHDSKNISCGEGGALLINDEDFIERAEILWEKGTNRSKFIRGEVDKYTWVDIGSSFLASEIAAAFLLGQLERVEQINNARLHLWNHYYESFAEAEALNVCGRPYIPANCKHNGHIFYLILNDGETRTELLGYLKANGISAAFHYVPLHDSPAGKRFGRTPFPLPHTEKAGHCLIRLPLFPDMTPMQQERVISLTNSFLLSIAQKKYMSSTITIHDKKVG
ncbi:dTDP-4-amino-4,6-dideoxygalactose transaminase [Aquicella lusitana]|uniref:dTDP-4-amino-4,6-dideoxygalactose transaminase n=1 Tax=Aquicella lusitana TaxID=254246 RepID=A0A370FY27_9COXI|nr:dTDP-4-amino-4,6-dideoxygalactose transaminase [Aquicella lusitana]RDI36442.1 dTDP-4-amino-4,6-dideoxygalactose transaminase [Aquicella lusitana]VVC72808.1 dTDP-4-amino-4,6-dideoxygalactose transaminase [Aquicella lusitana]